MAAKYIIGALAIASLTAATIGVSRGGGLGHPQTKTWLIIGAIFAAVSAWLFSRG